MKMFILMIYEIDVSLFEKNNTFENVYLYCVWKWNTFSGHPTR